MDGAVAEMAILQRNDLVRHVQARMTLASSLQRLPTREFKLSDRLDYRTCTIRAYTAREYRPGAGNPFLQHPWRATGLRQTDYGPNSPPASATEVLGRGLTVEQVVPIRQVERYDRQRSALAMTGGKLPVWPPIVRTMEAYFSG